MQNIFARYGIYETKPPVPFGNGLINTTWSFRTLNGEQFILQKVNTHVFKEPDLIAANLHHLGSWLGERFPEYLLPVPLAAINGDLLVKDEQGSCYRLFPFVKGSHSIDVLTNPAQAYEAARAFGKFTRLLAACDPKLLKVTIPGFHDLSARYAAFLRAVAAASPDRHSQGASAVNFLKAESSLVTRYEAIITNPDFKVRVTHHDTKISNVLFNLAGQSLCVIDLDTVMPGFFFSDLGDMIRTYVCPVSEEEEDLSLIEVRTDYLKAVLDGYLTEMETELTIVEKEYLVWSGLFMIYMQALRFLTDYLNNDIYYGARYPLHNLNRALNQIELYKKLERFSSGIPYSFVDVSS